jgi:hypothetical protein
MTNTAPSTIPVTTIRLRRFAPMRSSARALDRSTAARSARMSRAVACAVRVSGCANQRAVPAATRSSSSFAERAPVVMSGRRLRSRSSLVRCALVIWVDAPRSRGSANAARRKFACS